MAFRSCLRFGFILLAGLSFCAAIPGITYAEGPFTVKRELKRFGAETDQPRIMVFSAGFAVNGLWGPVPEGLPAIEHLNTSYPKDSKSYLSRQPDAGPFVTITGFQVAGQPVSIAVTAPKAEELGTLTSGDGDSFRFLRPEKRKFIFHHVLLHEYNESNFNELIQLKVDGTAGTMSYTPLRHQYQGRTVTLAPVVIEVLVEYSCTQGTMVNNNPGANTEEPITYTLRLGWLMLPPCGDLVADSVVTCPGDLPPVAAWQTRQLGDLSIAIPDTWHQELSPDKDQGQWEIDSAKPETAGVMLLRDHEVDQFLENMETAAPEQTMINGEKATLYRGRIPKKNLDSALYVLDRKDHGDRQVLLGLVAASWKSTAPLLEAIAGSLTYGEGAILPKISADLTANSVGSQLSITSNPATTTRLEAPDMAKQETEQSLVVPPETVAEPEDTLPLTVAQPPEESPSQPSANQATQMAQESSSPAVTPAAEESTQPPAESQSHVSANPTEQASQPQLSAQLIRKKTVKDYVGRNEDLKGNGAADSRIRVRITAPGKTIAAIHIQSTEGLEAAWDTIPGNDRWLIAATNGQELLNKEDGSIHYPLPDSELKFNLWVQDNNAISSTKTKLILILEMDDGGKFETAVTE